MKFKVSLDVDVVEASSPAMAIEVAKGHLSVEEIKETIDKVVEIYVDGSHKDGIAVGGFLVVIDGKEAYHQVARVKDDLTSESWNVSAEVKAAMMATRWAEKNGFIHITLYHDYTGIAYWITPDPKFGKVWKAKSKTAVEYVKYMGARNVNINFEHVKGHSGNLWNDKIDAYVGAEVEALLNEETEVS